jgi:hypothetical protein
MRRGARTALAVAAGIACAGGAHGLGAAAHGERDRWPAVLDEPYAPSPAAAPFVAFGFREVAADLLWIRAIGYFGGDDDTADGVRSLIDAIVALDPHVWRAYSWGAIAVNNARGGDDNRAGLWAVDLLEKGMLQFPESWELPITAGQILVLDLKSDDPAQVAAWRDRGLLLLERGVRMPGAPEGLATLIAHMRTELGQHERAVTDLREMILLAKDERAKRKLIDKLASLEASSADDIRAELDRERRRFEERWFAERPELPATMYVLVGPRPVPRTPADLAIDRDLFGAEAAAATPRDDEPPPPE